MSETEKSLPADEADPKEETAEAGSGSRLTAEQWEEIYAHYEYGTLKPKEILDKYKISSAALSKRIRKLRDEGRVLIRGSKKVELKEAAEKAIKEAAERVASTFAGKKLSRIEQSKETLYTASQANQHFFNNILKDIAAGRRTVSSAANDFKALRHSELLIKAFIENRYRLLDIDNMIDEEQMPKLIIEDLSKEDIEEIQRRGADEDDDFDPADLDFDESGEDEIVEAKPSD